MSHPSGLANSFPWAWKHYPLIFDSKLNCHDGTALVPIATGRNLRYPSEFRVRSSTLLTPGQVLGILTHDANDNQVHCGVGHHFYLPTDDDLAIVRELFPLADPWNPSWVEVETALIMSGMEKADLRKHNATTLVRLLKHKRIANTSVSPVGGRHLFTLGQLLTTLQGSEAAFEANSRTAERVAAKDGAVLGQWWRATAGALLFRPDTAAMPGIDRIQILCDELNSDGGLTAANVARVRAKVCRAKPCSLAEANELSLDEVADILEIIFSKPSSAPASTVRNKGTKKKRSTERGEGRAKLIAALTRHHQYADGGCLNLNPIGNNELAEAADVSTATASDFFKDKFQGFTKYKALCRDAGGLVAALKLLNNEFAPHDLYGRRPANEGNEDDQM